MADCGTRTRYRDGCRCDKCKAANADYQRRYTARNMSQRAKQPAAVGRNAMARVVAMPTTVVPTAPAAVPEVGRNEAAVIAQCEQSKKADELPSIVAQAITLARIMDDASAAAMWPTTSRQLQSLLTDLNGPLKKSRGRLASVQAMTRPRQQRLIAQ